MKVFLILFFNILFINSQTITDKQLTFVKKVILSTAPLIGHISEIVIANDNIIITDMINNQVTVYDIKGNFIKNLDFEECTPGVKVMPQALDANSKIISVVSGSYPYLFLFDKDFNCLNSIKLNYYSSRVKVFENKYIFVPKIKQDNISLNKYDILGSLVKEIKRGDKRFGGLISNTMNQALLLIDHKFVIAGDITTYKFDLYDHNLSKIKTFGVRPKYFKETKPPKVKKITIEEMFKNIEDIGSLIYTIDWYDTNHILIQYSIERGRKNKVGIQIINIYNNKLVYENVIKGTNRFLYVYNKILVNVEQPKPDKKTGDLPNPEIVFYKINL